MTTDPNLSSVVQAILEIGIMVATGIIASAVHKYAAVAAQKLHFTLSSQDQDAIDRAVHTVALVGETMLRQRVLYGDNIRIDDPTIAKFANTVAGMASDAVKRAGLTNESIANMLVAQIDETLGLPEPPNTPPAQVTPAAPASPIPASSVPVLATSDTKGA